MNVLPGVTSFTKVCNAFCNLGKQNDIFYVLDDITKAVGDKADEVGSNSVYGIGLLSQYSKVDI